MPLRGISAAILAGGRGTRLRPVVAAQPKVLAQVAGRPFLFILLDQLAAAGIRHAVLCTGYMAEQIRATVGETYRGIRIDYSNEDHPLGTGGALRQALPLLNTTTILAMNGDSFCGADLVAYTAEHRHHATHASLLLTEVTDTARYGRVSLDAAGRVTEFTEKAASTGAGLINAGVYLIEREALARVPAGKEISFEREVLPGWIAAGMHGHRAAGRFIDIGTPESLALAQDVLRCMSEAAA